MLKILVYSDSGYESLIEAFLISRRYAGKEEIPVIYYSVGFDSSLDYPNLEKRRWEIDSRRPGLNYYKPSIILDSLKYDDHLCFMDADILLSRRFDPERIINLDFDFPIASSGPQEHVWRWEVLPGQDEVIIYDERKLMSYYGVAERSCAYLWSSMVSYNRNCQDFMEEWDSIVSNPYLLKNHNVYFPLSDETAFNVTMWKRDIRDFKNMIFFNTTGFESFINIETNDNVVVERDTDYEMTRNDGKLFEICDDSSKVLFYHGFKPGEELDRVIRWMKTEIILQT